MLDDLQARADSGAFARAVEVATRVAAIDTGAIEGCMRSTAGSR